MAVELHGISVNFIPDYPRVSGISIEKAISMPVLAGIAVDFRIPKKQIAITNKGYSHLICDSKKIAMTEKGFAVNLNQSNASNVFYQLI